MDRWIGRVALVSGASTGIGAAISEELVKAGMKVVGFARRIHKIEEMAERLKAEKGELHPVAGDVSQEEDILAAFQWVSSNLGGIDVLINNAGVLIQSRISDFDASDWRGMYDVNVFGLCICTREAIKSMKARRTKEGIIININSIAGHRLSRTPQNSVYGSTKYAVTYLTSALRSELAASDLTNIKVTSISPGLVETDMAANRPENAKKLSPHDIAKAVTFTLQVPPSVQVAELTILPIGGL